MSSSEYNQLLKFLYFEGYADSYEEAENLLEEMSDEEFEDLLENQTWQNIRRASSTSKTNTTPIKLTGSNTALRPGDFTPEDPEKTEKRAKRGKLSFEVREDFDAIVEFLFVEGYADTIENAELMAENISEEWVDEILDEKHVKAMDTTGRGADRRASDLGGVPQRRKPTPDKYKHLEGDFSPRDLSPGARRRRDERRQGVGGFNEAKADPQDAVQRLRARNMRLQQDHPEVPSGRDQTEYRRKRHQESRGKKKGL